MFTCVPLYSGRAGIALTRVCPSICPHSAGYLTNASMDVNQTWLAWTRDDALEVLKFWRWSDFGRGSRITLLS